MKKSPAFQWYPKDYLADEHVVPMTLEEEGAYRRLMDFCWLHGSIPDDMKVMAGMCKNVSPARMKKLWSAVAPCFRLKAGRWVHPRLEKERRSQESRKKAQSDAGKAGAKRRWDKEKNRVAIVSPMGSDSSASASASATASTEEKHTPRDPVFGTFDDLAIASIRGRYGWDDREGTDERVWGSTPTADRQRLIQIAVLRIEGEGKTFNGVFFRSVLLKVVAEQSGRVDDVAAWLAKGEAS